MGDTFINEKTLTNCSFNMADISMSSLPASNWLTLDMEIGIIDCKRIFHKSKGISNDQMNKWTNKQTQTLSYMHVRITQSKEDSFKQKKVAFKNHLVCFLESSYWNLSKFRLEKAPQNYNLLIIHWFFVGSF